MAALVRPARIAFAAVAWSFAASTIVQIYLAGVGVFDSPSAFVTHRDFGYLIGLMTLVLVVLALLGRTGRLLIGASFLLLVLLALQSVFVLVREDAPMVAALHPLNGFLIAGVGVATAWLARTLLRQPAAAGTRSNP